LLICLGLSPVGGVQVSADPVLTVTDSGTANGNQIWLVEVAPDPGLFGDTPDGFGGALAVELDFMITDSEIVSVTKNAADWPNENPGFNPFINDISHGVTFDMTTAFISLGSDLFTTGDPAEVATIETLGAGLGTLKWGGNVAAPAGAAEYNTARIAQAGMKFDGFHGMLAPAAGLRGDYSGNGLVEQADLDLVLSHWGQATPPLPDGWVNDPPDDLIDQGELDRVLSNWGARGLGSVAVPEPASVSLLLLGCGMLTVWTKGHWSSG
jgi:hypothetical protein